MANWAAYAEAERRGILPNDKQAAYDEAKRRGLVPGYGKKAELPAEPKSASSVRNALGKLVGRGSDALETAKNIGKVYPVGETAAQIATSTYAVPLSGLAGLAAMTLTGGKKIYNVATGKEPASNLKNIIGEGTQTATDVINKVQDILTYRPKTEGGKQLSEASTYPFGLLKKGADVAAEKTYEMTGSPAAAATIGTAIEGAPLLLSLKGSKTPNVGEVVETGMSKGIRKSVAGKETATQIFKYNKRAESAVQDIIRYNENIQYFDSSGNFKRAGGLPETVEEFGQAIEQTKRKIFSEYDNLKTEAENYRYKRDLEYPLKPGERAVKKPGEYGYIETRAPSIELNQIAAELNTIIDSGSLRLASKETIEYAKSRKADLVNEGKITLSDAQDAIQIYNESLKAYHRNPSPILKGQAVVDEMIANNLRKALDKEIEGATGVGYQPLKNRYGALRSIEKDVNHRAIVHGRRSPKGFFDITDVYTGYHAIKAILSKDPIGMAASASGKFLIERMKFKNNPDRIIKSMFKEAEKGMMADTTPKITGKVTAIAGTSREEGNE